MNQENKNIISALDKADIDYYYKDIKILINKTLQEVETVFNIKELKTKYKKRIIKSLYIELNENIKKELKHANNTINEVLNIEEEETPIL